MIRLPVIACLALTAAVHAIGPSDYASAGDIHNDAANAAFLAAVTNLGAQYANSTGTATAGAAFSNEHGLPSAIHGGGGDVGVRIWFVSQDAGYDNALGVRIGSSSSVILPDSHAAAFGDYVDLNGGKAVHPDLHFFALANIIGGDAQYLWQGPKGLNGDHTTHLNIDYSAPFASAGSLWYALALDDQFKGGDRDWNDLRVIIQLHPIAAPEPATIALFAGFIGVAVWMARRRRALLAA